MNWPTERLSDRGVILITGAAGHIGSAVRCLLSATQTHFLAVDVAHDAANNVLACDLRRKDEIARLFEDNPIRAVIHLAGILPTAFRSDPLFATDVNLGGSFELLKQAVKARVKRFVFGSSMSVYGTLRTAQPVTEDAPKMPNDPYGSAKRVVELVGETLASQGAIEFVSLRIARVIGPGIKKTSSPWRAEILERSSGDDLIQLPFAPDAVLSLVHVDDIARMLVTLAEAPRVGCCAYNTHVERWNASDLKREIEEARGVRVELQADGSDGGPRCDGSRFAAEFGFALRGLRERLST
jgi:nucleoside-diphosphate-sugar epimerase